MANALKGEVVFEAAGKEYTLRFDTNAICDLEDRLDLGIADIAERLRVSPRMSLVRATFRSALTDDLSTAEVGDLIDLVSTRRAVELLGQAFERAFPPDDEDEAKEPAGNGIAHPPLPNAAAIGGVLS